MNLVPGRNHPCLMVKCLLLFTRFCRDKISSRDELTLYYSRVEILKLVCFFFFFFRGYSNMFEHNESMNIMKHITSLSKMKSDKKKDEHKK